MSRLKISVLNASLGAALVLSLSACNRDANADVANAQSPGTAALNAAAAPPPEPAGPKYGRVVSVDPVREAASAAQRQCHDEWQRSEFRLRRGVDQQQRGIEIAGL